MRAVVLHRRSPEYQSRGAVSGTAIRAVSARSRSPVWLLSDLEAKRLPTTQQPADRERVLSGLNLQPVISRIVATRALTADTDSAWWTLDEQPGLFLDGCRWTERTV